MFLKDWRRFVEDSEMFTVVFDISKYVHLDRAPEMDEGGVYSIFFKMGMDRKWVGLEMLGNIPLSTMNISH